MNEIELGGVTHDQRNLRKKDWYDSSICMKTVT